MWIRRLALYRSSENPTDLVRASTLTCLRRRPRIPVIRLAIGAAVWSARSAEEKERSGGPIRAATRKRNGFFGRTPTTVAERLAEPIRGPKEVSGGSVRLLLCRRQATRLRRRPRV